MVSSSLDENILRGRGEIVGHTSSLRKIRARPGEERDACAFELRARSKGDSDAAESEYFDMLPCKKAVCC